MKKISAISIITVLLVCISVLSISASDSLTLKNGSFLEIKDGYLYGLPINTKNTQVEANFNESVKCDFTNVQTGGKVSDGSNSLEIVLRGDVSKDGKLTSVDYTLVKTEFKKSFLTGSAFRAADTDESGSIKSTDYMLIKKHFSGAIDLYYGMDAVPGCTPLMIQYSTKGSQATELQAPGMGYLFRTSKGRFIAIDGGHQADAEDFINLAKKYSDGKPEIAMWIVTHPHSDHYGVLEKIYNTPSLRSEFTVDNMLMCLPPREYVDVSRNDPYDTTIDMLHELGPLLNAPELHAVRGDKYYVDDICIEILLTCEDHYYQKPNDLCMVFRITVKGQVFLFMADVDQRPTSKLCKYWGEDLKCDFLQLAHHGMGGGSIEAYHYAQPEICLAPMSKPAYDIVMYGEYSTLDSTRANRWMLQTVKDANIWFSYDGDKVIELPYKFD